ncbi:hypothetical protein [Chitinophaga solisilvae]|uniref:Uncharacterized protein n=1 Tax=Chitinophaga solisilvae TaxID=1233460 RepID=A0A3S1CUS8_9BACT|nr:hypothetical protein [Chitinophaga solisilvae]NSL91048.1 hypothetical protein [Chitinophaga solisilvae]
MNMVWNAIKSDVAGLSVVIALSAFSMWNSHFRTFDQILGCVTSGTVILLLSHRIYFKTKLTLKTNAECFIMHIALELPPLERLRVIKSMAACQELPKRYRRAAEEVYHNIVREINNGDDSQDPEALQRNYASFSMN